MESEETSDVSPTRPANDVDLSYRELACPHKPLTAVPTATPAHTDHDTTRNKPKRM